MVIQGSINNLLQTVGVAARLSPQYEEMIGERRGKTEAAAKKAEIGVETEASRKAADISRQAYIEAKAEAVAKGKAATYEQLTGQRKALGAHIANVEKLRVYEPSEKLEQELQSLYKEYEPIDKEYQERRIEYSERGYKAAETKRAKKAEAERQAAEALALEQEKAEKSKAFRQMFTEGGRFK